MIRGKVLIIVGDATETLDTMYPYYRLIEAGFQPVVAAPEKRRYQMVLHEVKPGWTITKEWEGYSIEADIAFRDMNDQKAAIKWFSKNLEQRGSSEATCDQRADKICSSVKALIQMAASATPQTPADIKAFDKMIAPEEPEEETPVEGSGAEGSGEPAPVAGSGDAP